MLWRSPSVSVAAGEDPHQRSQVVEHAALAQLVLELAQEALLARGAHDVVVEVAEAHVGQRLLAAQPLVAGAEVDLRPVLGDRQAGVGVVVAAVDVDVDAAEVVDRVGEAAERGRDRVVDPERPAPRAQQRLDRARGEIEPAEAVGLVDLHPPVAGDLDREVARDREHGGGALLRIDAQQHQRVRAGVLLRGAEAAIGADEQERLRLAGLRPRHRPGPELGAMPVALEVRGEAPDLEQTRGGDGAAREDHHDQPAEQHLQQLPAGALRQLRAGRRRPPGEPRARGGAGRRRIAAKCGDLIAARRAAGALARRAGGARRPRCAWRRSGSRSRSGSPRSGRPARPRAAARARSRAGRAGRRW